MVVAVVVRGLVVEKFRRMVTEGGGFTCLNDGNLNTIVNLLGRLKVEVEIQGAMPVSCSHCLCQTHAIIMFESAERLGY